ncbi:MAG: hypothetical protein HFJ52_00245 [Clostridia bacterium]|jgi:hypothetical protein|nr:hypothetical protein [Clostridia bacterium]
MLITSQDKKEVVNFDNTLSLKFYHDDEDTECLYEIHTTVNAPGDNYILLGTYKTEKRALEVLEEIATAFATAELLKSPQLRVGGGLVNGKAFIKVLAYQMPEE